MQPASLALSVASVAPPALLAGAVVLSFFLGHYTTERKNRRDFLRWCDNNRPRPVRDTLADPPTVGRHRWTDPSSGLYGVGTSAHGFWGSPDAVGPFIYNHARGYALAILSVGLMLLARLLLEPALQGRLPYVFFSGAVLVTALYTGIWETLLALILGFLAAEWFIVEPRASFMISGTHGWLGALLYFIIGLGIVWFKRSENTAQLQTLASNIAYLDRLKELDRERALRATMTNIVENSPDAILALTTDNRIMSWNAAAEKLLGYTRHEAVGQPLDVILLAQERKQAQQILGTLHRGRPTQQWRTTLSCKDGTQLQASLNGASARDADGKVIGVSLVARPCV
jgi:PAS domain S-box-containing protein